jgi:CRISPR/Cas system-associated exonuclease Cas4 (RecB family)
MSLVPWSYSKLKAFETCPKQFYHVKVLKQYPQKETDAMRYGTDVHLACEEYIRDDKPLPKKYAYCQPILDALRKKDGVKLCEYELGVTEQMEPCGFKDEDVWFRGIADLLIIDRDNKLAWVIDYKTGKSAKYADTNQLDLMALAVFRHFPDIDRVRGGLVFLVANKLIKKTVHRDDAMNLWGQYLDRQNQMTIASDNDVWNAHPSGLCYRHCDVLECAHNGRN